MTVQDRHRAASRPPSRPGTLLPALFIAWVLFYAVFKTYPDLDTGFSALLCVKQGDSHAVCDVFPAQRHWLANIARTVFYWVPLVAIGVMTADLAWQAASSRWRQTERMRRELLAISAYLLGTTLVVNMILKAYSGRPRPFEVSMFGGDMPFHAVGDFTGTCPSNCAFVSGEAAAAGWLLCLLPLLRGPARRLQAALLVTISLATPLLRVAFGSHFLSDVVVGWLIGAISAPALAVTLALIQKGISATLDRVR